MSLFRLLSLLVVVLVVVCASVLPASADYTTACLNPSGQTYGVSVSDAPLNMLYGLESYYSSKYSVLCAWRGMYGIDADGNYNSIWGPWHGNNNDPNCDVWHQNFFAQVNWPQYGPGIVSSRINSANGYRVITSFILNSTCDSSSVCAGNCPGYSSNNAQYQNNLSADPTYQTEVMSYPVEVDAPPYNYVATTFNSTWAVTNVADPQGVNPIVSMSVVSSMQQCYGQVTQSCPSTSTKGVTAQPLPAQSESGQ